MFWKCRFWSSSLHLSELPPNLDHYKNHHYIRHRLKFKVYTWVHFLSPYLSHARLSSIQQYKGLDFKSISTPAWFPCKSLMYKMIHLIFYLPIESTSLMYEDFLTRKQDGCIFVVIVIPKVLKESEFYFAPLWSFWTCTQRRIDRRSRAGNPLRACHRGYCSPGQTSWHLGQNSHSCRQFTHQHWKLWFSEHHCHSFVARSEPTIFSSYSGNEYFQCFLD